MQHTLRLLLLLLTALHSAHSCTTVNKFWTLTSLCVTNTTSVTELPAATVAAFVKCHETSNCHHVLTVTESSHTHNLGVMQLVPQLTDNKPHHHCTLYTKNSSLMSSFKQLNFCPLESGTNLKQMQPMPHLLTQQACAFDCLLTSKCEFFRFNASCYTGSLATFMVSKAANVEGCEIMKKIRSWDNDYVAFYSFNNSLENLVDKDRYSMEKVGNPSVTAEGVHVSHDNYVKSEQQVLTLRNEYVSLGKELTIVIRLKRSISSRKQTIVTFSNTVDVGNFGLLAVESPADRQLQLHILGTGTGSRFSSFAASDLVSPNQEKWICASVSFNSSVANWTVDGVRRQDSDVSRSDNFTDAEYKWQMLVIGQSGDLSLRDSLTGVVQSLAVIGSWMGEQQVLQVC